MLKVWHLPAAPFIRQQDDNIIITLWVKSEAPPARVTLRAERDNEEISLAMRRLRAAPAPGVRAWRAEIALDGGQPRRRYAFTLLWQDRQRASAGLIARPIAAAVENARTSQVAVLTRC